MSRMRLSSIFLFSLLSGSALAITSDPTTTNPNGAVLPAAGSSDNSASASQGVNQLENDALSATKGEYDQ